MKTFISLLLFAIVVLTACNRHAYTATNKQYKKQVKAYAKALRTQPATAIAPPPFWVGTTNFSMRKPNLVVIHHTAQNSCEQTLKTFTLPRTSVSAHYVICKDGTVHHMLNDYLRAWHGGAGRWGTITDVNSASIGIELDNNGTEPFAEPQMKSLLTLLDTLKKRHNIPATHFIAHADMAPTRKVDPNIHFPWQQLAQRGFGLWYGDTTAVTVPDNFNHLQALRVIGYDVRDSVAAIGAFKRKYLQQESKQITAGDRKVLYALYQQYH
jgi:N-acetylmuramoyl-L-alanine amidase